MKQMLFEKKFPIFKLEVDKSDTSFNSTQELTNYFKQLIDAHKVTRFIAEFDHYSHTRGLHNGEIANQLIDARNIIFCFGGKLPEAEMLAIRPRSIGIAETEKGFIVSFMETPMAVANDTMQTWVESIVKDTVAA